VTDLLLEKPAVNPVLRKVGDIGVASGVDSQRLRELQRVPVGDEPGVDLRRLDPAAPLGHPQGGVILAAEPRPYVLLKEQDRLGYRAKTLPHFAAFFRDHTTEKLQSAGDLVQTFQQIKGVGPYTAAIMASHASRNTDSFGLDVWNRKILARRLLDAEDAAPEAVTRRLNKLFPGHAGTAGLYFVEHEYLNAPVAPLLDPAGIGAWNEALERPAP
jgi:hypothetical protein